MPADAKLSPEEISKLSEKQAESLLWTLERKRRAARISVREFTNAIDIGEQTWIMNINRHSRPRLETLCRAAHYFGLQVCLVQSPSVDMPVPERQEQQPCSDNSARLVYLSPELSKACSTD